MKHLPFCRNSDVTCHIFFINHLLQELISANGERHRLYEENNNLDMRLKELTAEYTNRLQQYIHDIAVSVLYLAFFLFTK